MHSLFPLLLICIAFNQKEHMDDQAEFCQIVKAVVSAGNLENQVQHVSKVIGKCNAIVYETPWLDAKYHLDRREYMCGDWRIGVFSHEGMFGEQVVRAIQFDQIIQRGNKLVVTYSIVEFFQNGRQGFDQRTLRTSKIKLVKTPDGYK
jgi:hypothetical protein